MSVGIVAKKNHYVRAGKIEFFPQNGRQFNQSEANRWKIQNKYWKSPDQKDYKRDILETYL